MKIIIFQRVLPKYRYELLKKLSENDQIKSLCIIATKGERSGAQKSYTEVTATSKFFVDFVSSLNFSYKGKFRSTLLPFYPLSYFKLLKYDVILLEGTTNILNNIFIIPIAKIFSKKVIWWDAGYSESQRSTTRKIKDFILSLLIRLTDKQMAYSSDAKDYMYSYMGAKNVFLNVNTIATDYFEKNRQFYKDAVEIKLQKERLNLLYVGAIEKRKKVLELINIVKNLQDDGKNVLLSIIGNGKDKDEMINSSKSLHYVKFYDAIYEYEKLEHFYLDSHFFIMPGEGGLGIIQAMQFGVPVITVKADGTENDYIKNGVDGYICDSLEDVESILRKYLNNFALYKNLAYKTIEKANIINSQNWITNFVKEVTTL